MKHRNIIIGLLLLAVCSLSACSEDDITADETRGEPAYVLSPGEPGSVEELIYEFYERYGTYVYYEFDDVHLRYEWTSPWSVYYVPVQPDSEEYVKRMLTFLQENIFDNYTDDFVKRSLVYEIYLVDSCKTATYTSSYSDIAVSDHKYVIANVRPEMEDFTEERWNEIRNAVFNQFVLGFYNAAPIKPTEFIALREEGSFIDDDDQEDPLGEYSNMDYSWHLIGFMGPKVMAWGPTMLYPDIEVDFADYLTMLTTSTKTELTNLLTRFERVRERALALVPYLNNTLNLNVVETQNKNCPEDPISENFFSQF